MSLPPSNNKTVLITGINGYIASVLGALVLEKGYLLRGTSRRLASTEALLAGPYAQYKDRVQMYEVQDMTADGAFDEAVKGVHGIFHVASPLDFSLVKYEETVVIATKGNQVLLASASKAGPQLESVVVTSSVAAIVDPDRYKSDHTWTEAEFASISLAKAEKDLREGVSSPPGILYQASKTAAERSVWEFRTEKRPSFSISAINPAIVVGPPKVLPTTGKKLNETLLPIFQILSGASDKLPPNYGTGAFVDVRDVATLHLWAFENPTKSDGERYIAAGREPAPHQATADILYEKYRGTKIGDKLIRGTPGEEYVGYDKQNGTVGKIEYLPGRVQISGEKARRETGIEYISFKKAIIDTAQALEKLL